MKSGHWAMVIIGIIALLGLLAFVFSRKEYTLEADDITIEYEEKIPLENFKITQTSWIVYQKEIPVSSKMIVYDPEFIGTQEAFFSYKDEEMGFQLTILQKKLDPPILSLVENKVKWDEVGNAAKYQLSINDENMILTETEFDLSDYISMAGTIKIEAKAISENKKWADSDSSNIVEITKLETVKDIWYQNGMLLWDAIEGADNYYITINGVEHTTSKNEFSVAEFVEGENQVKVVALSDKKSVVASAEYEKNFHKLKVQNINYDSGILQWESNVLPGECKYNVMINETLFETSSNYYEYPLSYDIEYLISVQAIPLDTQSIESDIAETTIVYKKLEKPQVSIMMGNYKDTYVIKLGEVKNADNYKVVLTLHMFGHVLKKDYTMSSLEKEFEVTEDTSKIVAEVVAVDSSGQYIDSDVAVAERIIN